MKFKKIGAILLTLIMTVAVCGNAFAMDFSDMLRGSPVSEAEPNNTHDDAQELSDDDTVYGVISSKTDVDWYKVTFPSDGVANFWCGDTTYPLTMELYKGDTYKEAGKQFTTSNQTYIEKYDVEADVEYYIKLTGSSVTSYQFRARLQSF